MPVQKNSGNLLNSQCMSLIDPIYAKSSLSLSLSIYIYIYIYIS